MGFFGYDKSNVGCDHTDIGWSKRMVLVVMMSLWDGRGAVQERKSCDYSQASVFSFGLEVRGSWEDEGLSCNARFIS